MPLYKRDILKNKMKICAQTRKFLNYDKKEKLELQIYEHSLRNSINEYLVIL